MGSPGAAGGSLLPPWAASPWSSAELLMTLCSGSHTPPAPPLTLGSTELIAIYFYLSPRTSATLWFLAFRYYLISEVSPVSLMSSALAKDGPVLEQAVSGFVQPRGTPWPLFTLMGHLYSPSYQNLTKSGQTNSAIKLALNLTMQSILKPKS